MLYSFIKIPLMLFSSHLIQIRFHINQALRSLAAHLPLYFQLISYQSPCDRCAPLTLLASPVLLQPDKHSLVNGLHTFSCCLDGLRGYQHVSTLDFLQVSLKLPPYQRFFPKSLRKE